MNQIFLLFIGFSISILTYGQPISYSTAPSPAYNDGQNPEIFVQSTALDLCDSIKLVYLKVNYNDVYLQKKAIKTVRVKIRDSKSTANTYQFYTLPVDKYGITSGGGTENNYNQPLTVPWAKTNPHYFEMEVYNVRGAIQYLETEIALLNETQQVVYTTGYNISLIEEPGVVDVTDHMGLLLDAFQKTENTSILSYFCDKEISHIELLAFFQEYLGYSEEQICEALRLYDMVANNQTSNVDYQWARLFTSQITCTFFDDFLNGIPPFDPNNPEDYCRCKTIRTKANAANFGAIEVSQSSGLVPGPDCRAYTPRLYADHFLPGAFNGNDDDLMLLSGIMGAAKGEVFFAQVDGGDHLPTNRDLSNPFVSYGYITFRSVCVDPTTLAIPTYQCQNCKKEIEFSYRYNSYGEAYAREGSYFFGDDRIGMTADEFASLVVVNNGQLTVVDTTGFKFIIDCDAKNEWNLDTILVKGKGLLDAIKSITGLDSGIVAAQLAISAISKILEGKCEEIVNEEASMSGTYTYILEPGQRFDAIMTSESAYRAYADNSATGYTQILADYYMAAVLKTIPDSSGVVPEYCECEAIASYTWGSMDGHTPPQERPRDDNANTNYYPDFDRMFLYPPIGEYDLRQIIGSFIGTAGEWGDNFENAGCCAVVIPCHADCVYVVGCDDEGQDEDGGILILDNDAHVDIQADMTLSDNNVLVKSDISTEEKLDIRSKAADVQSRILLYPNPTQSLLEIKWDINTTISENQMVKSIKIYNLSGQLMPSIMASSQSDRFHVDVQTLPQGMYVVHVIYQDNLSSIHKFIKE